jgi:hypothetical protein
VFRYKMVKSGRCGVLFRESLDLLVNQPLTQRLMMAAESRNFHLYVSYNALKRKFCSTDKTG